MTPMTSTPTPPGESGPYMLASLQSAHQHADTKAGILAAAQAALTGTAGSWTWHAAELWRRGGGTGVLAGALLVLFACGLSGGVGCLAAALRPRVWRPSAANRYSYVHFASGGGLPGADGADGADGANGADGTAAERAELAPALRFLARVAVVKYRCVTGAVVCTAVMGASAGLCLALRPLLG
ncbi:Pycsar system effector family protein [Streptomyces luteireticuli]|uniref:Pycsar effector protein domain-containing protein n=1 Tax=Streptomyces luteireticuli TaxID=173858 RepID=A0ABP3IGT3_9ACTN